jgi:hypothetical protein
MRERSGDGEQLDLKGEIAPGQGVIVVHFLTSLPSRFSTDRTFSSIRLGLPGRSSMVIEVISLAVSSRSA